MRCIGDGLRSRRRRGSIRADSAASRRIRLGGSLRGSRAFCDRTVARRILVLRDVPGRLERRRDLVAAGSRGRARAKPAPRTERGRPPRAPCLRPHPRARRGGRPSRVGRRAGSGRPRAGPGPDTNRRLLVRRRSRRERHRARRNPQAPPSLCRERWRHVPDAARGRRNDRGHGRRRRWKDLRPRFVQALPETAAPGLRTGWVGSRIRGERGASSSGSPGSCRPGLLQEPSDQWMDAAAGGRLLAPDSQRKSGRSGRPLPGGGDVVVLRRGNEIRVATVSGHRVVRSWRVTSETPIAEVQLAEPRGAGLVLVARVYTDDQDEFVVLVLDAKRLVRSFSLDSADWAETAPLSKFRLVGSSLYQLGSTAAGLFVDRFELEGN